MRMIEYSVTTFSCLFLSACSFSPLGVKHARDFEKTQFIARRDVTSTHFRGARSANVHCEKQCFLRIKIRFPGQQLIFKHRYGFASVFGNRYHGDLDGTVCGNLNKSSVIVEVRVCLAPQCVSVSSIIFLQWLSSQPTPLQTCRQSFCLD